jgi:hypothetical protein
MDIAISYLRQLARQGYFATAHTMCDGVWVNGHPACKDAATWAAVRDFLVEHGYLTVARPSPAELARMELHPKDQLDAWWFELTGRGAEAVR